MANINETILEVEKLSPELARQIKKYVKNHSYGLVYENNLPESVRLYKKSPTVGDTVNILPERGKKETDENQVAWIVKKISGDVARIYREDEEKDVAVDDIVPLVSYRDVIYPGLKEIDRIERGNPEDPYHMVINAENYHALEALMYAYAGKVDCIYIDPPYNTGAKDWKYNNDYVGSEDKYRHSKWLAFMQRRLELAKKLLNPHKSVLIVTIDERENHRLGMLLEQVFPESSVQMVSSIINRKGVSPRGQEQKTFARGTEYVYFVFIGIGGVCELQLTNEWMPSGIKTTRNKLRYADMMRHGKDGRRESRPNLFYPVYVSNDGKRFIGVGKTLYKEKSNESKDVPPNSIAIFPIHSDGTEGCWSYSQDGMLELQKAGYLRLGQLVDGKMSISFIQPGWQKRIESGEVRVIGHREDNSVIIDDTDYCPKFIPMDSWNIASHNASEYGMKLLQNIIGTRFSFPKSLYAVKDALNFIVSDNQNALIIDFFAGSGTTLHAVNLLNAEDGGHRRCICVTNNEVSESEEKEFIKAGLRPSDPDWEKYGIANYVTWPRTKCTIEGVDINGNPLKGAYIGSDIPMSDGFKANAIFCELTYESAWPIRLDNAFDAIAPILWMQAGCRGPIIRRIGKRYLTTDYYGVLFDYNQSSKFCEKVKATPSIKTVFIVTDDQRRYSNICKRLPGIAVHRLYETYLRTFEICGEGGLD